MQCSFMMIHPRQHISKHSPPFLHAYVEIYILSIFILCYYITIQNNIYAPVVTFLVIVTSVFFTSMETK